jgi:hypothetical protein
VTGRPGRRAAPKSRDRNRGIRGKQGSIVTSPGRSGISFLARPVPVFYRSTHVFPNETILRGERHPGLSHSPAGSDDSPRGANDLTRGADDLTCGSDGLTRGSSDLTRGSDDLTRGSDDLTRGSDDLTRGSNGLTRGSNDLTHGSSGLTHGSSDSTRGCAGWETRSGSGFSKRRRPYRSSGRHQPALPVVGDGSFGSPRLPAG